MKLKQIIVDCFDLDNDCSAFVDDALDFLLVLLMVLGFVTLLAFVNYTMLLRLVDEQTLLNLTLFLVTLLIDLALVYSLKD